jgi:EAL domain-containing protein (putative c-di-GMP-specific phosphodiesterase class I)
VLTALRNNRVRPGSLKLELTESLILDNIDSAVDKMNALKDAGVRFSMDDFGTGYSSLSYLTQLPLHQLKIDQSFVHKMHDKPVNAVIVQTIIGMANNLDIEVIAEGVETAEQFEFLKNQGCPLFQGYYFGKPVPESDFEQSLTSNTNTDTNR